MAVYPIKIDTLTMKHRGGTKAYHLCKITRADGKSILIKRWGKVDEWGQTQVLRGYDDTLASHWREKDAEKSRRGYQPGSTKQRFCEAESQLIVDLGKYWDSLAEAHRQFLTDLSDDELAKELEPSSEFEKSPDGVYRKPAPTKPAEPTAAETYAKNPRFGVFG